MLKSSITPFKSYVTSLPRANQQTGVPFPDSTGLLLQRNPLTFALHPKKLYLSLHLMPLSPKLHEVFRQHMFPHHQLNHCPEALHFTVHPRARFLLLPQRPCHQVSSRLDHGMRRVSPMSLCPRSSRHNAGHLMHRHLVSRYPPLQKCKLRILPKLLEAQPSKSPTKTSLCQPKRPQRQTLKNSTPPIPS